MLKTRHQEVQALHRSHIRTAARWPVWSLFPILPLVLAGCATLTRDVYTGYQGEDKPDAQLAIVRAESARFVGVDGQPVTHAEPKNYYYYEARLLPGVHTVTLSKLFLGSIYVVPGGAVEIVRSLTVDMKPGHVYELHADRIIGTMRVHMWIKDATTGEIVAEEKFWAR